MENQPSSQPQQTSPQPIPGFIQLLKETLSLFTSTFSHNLPFYTILFLGMIASIFMDQAKQAPYNLGMYWIFILMSYAFNVYGMASLIISLSNEKQEVHDVYNKTNTRLLTFMGALFLSGIIMAGGFMLLIIPGIIFGFWFYLVPYIVLLEDTGVREAFSRSKTYMTREGFSVVVKGVAIVIVTSIPVFLIGLIFGISDASNIISGLPGMLVVEGGIAVASTIIYGIQINSMFLLYTYVRRNNPQSTIQSSVSPQVQQVNPNGEKTTL